MNICLSRGKLVRGLFIMEVKMTAIEQIQDIFSQEGFGLLEKVKELPVLEIHKEAYNDTK